MSDTGFGAPKETLEVLIDISADDDLSAAFDIRHFRIAAIHAGTLTSTAITFKSAPTGDGTFYDLYDADGNPVSITVASERVTGVTGPAAAALAACRHLKIAMGSGEGADRTLTLLLTI